jgi:hypothetical protein
LKQLKAGGIAPGVQLQLSRGTTDEYALRVGSSTKVLHLSTEAASAIRIRSAH